MPEVNKDREPIPINTNGGTAIKGNVNTKGGDFIGRDKNINYFLAPQSIEGFIDRQLNQLYWKVRENVGLKNYVELDLIADGDQTTCDKFVAKHSHVVLHGQPGSGKSTLLWHILAQAVENYLQPDGKLSSPLPFYVSFANWGKGALLHEFLRRHWPYGGDPFDYMASHSVWLFADGIDECEAFDKNRLIELWSWFQQKNVPIKALLTCRTDTYHEVWQPTTKGVIYANKKSENAITFPYTGYKLIYAAEIATPLSERHFDKFVDAYLEEESQPFKQALQYHRPQWLSDKFLMLQTRNPQQLVLLLQTYKEEGKLPSNYGKMVESYVKSLWMRPSLMKAKGWVPFDEMCAALATFSEGFARHRRDGYVDENALLALGLRDYAQQNRNWLKYIIRLPYVVLEWIWLLPFALGYAVVSLLF